MKILQIYREGRIIGYGVVSYLTIAEESLGEYNVQAGSVIHVGLGRVDQALEDCEAYIKRAQS